MSEHHEPWSREAIEPLAAQCGCHVALTGGCLYGKGSRFRKDLDLIFFHNLGIVCITGSGWRYVGTYHNQKVDLLFPS